MVSLLLPVIYLAFISLGLPDALLGALRPLAARGWIEQTEAGFIPTPRGLFAAQNGRMKLEG